jgi:hypothetical protein
VPGAFLRLSYILGAFLRLSYILGAFLYTPNQSGLAVSLAMTHLGKSLIGFREFYENHHLERQ